MEWLSIPLKLHRHPEPMGFNFSSIVLCKLFSLSLFVVTINGYKHAEVQGMFVFGSSIVDNGNNNYLKNTSARANYPPYGIDFSLGPSGRFSNGRNPVDVLGELIGLPCLIPPFSDPRTKGGRIVHGVNFASGGSGILDQTGSLAGEVTSLNKQISNFEKITLPDLNARLAPKKSSQNHLSKYLFIVGTGGNDYLLNYFTSSPTKRTNLLNFTTVLIATLSSQLKKLHDLGARKFVVFSIQAIGCAPAVTARLPLGNGSCSKAMNEAALLFNDHLKALVGNSSSRMPGSEMVFVNSYKIIRDIIEDPARTGFLDTSKSCCDLSSNRGDGNGILCRRRGRTCGDRNAHVFFDGLHPTDAVNVRIANKAYSSNLEDEAYPTNVKRMITI